MDSGGGPTSSTGHGNSLIWGKIHFVRFFGFCPTSSPSLSCLPRSLLLTYSKSLTPPIGLARGMEMRSPIMPGLCSVAQCARPPWIQLSAPLLNSVSLPSGCGLWAMGGGLGHPKQSGTVSLEANARSACPPSGTLPGHCTRPSKCTQALPLPKGGFCPTLSSYFHPRLSSCRLQHTHGLAQLVTTQRPPSLSRRWLVPATGTGTSAGLAPKAH